MVPTSQMNADSTYGTRMRVIGLGYWAFAVVGGQVDFGGLSSRCHHLT